MATIPTQMATMANKSSTQIGIPIPTMNGIDAANLSRADILNPEPNSDQGNEKNNATDQIPTRLPVEIDTRVDQADTKKQRCDGKPAHVQAPQ
jgi:hypothetical protein